MQKQTVFYGVLDWGLGHATRNIPIIKNLLERNIDVILGSSGNALALLKIYFPHLRFYELPEYNVNYKHKSMLLNMSLQLPKIISTIKKENELLLQIVVKENITHIISDNRYGLYHEVIPSAFITHQLFIPTPILKKSVNQLNHQKIKKFKVCWIPDFEEENESLAGKLSHGKVDFKIEYIGPVSRFMETDSANEKKSHVERSRNISYKYVGIVSGPEPSRSDFEDFLLKEFSAVEGKHLLITGQPNKKRLASEHVEIVNHLNDQDFACAVKNAEKVFCRSGYSSIMDFYYLKVSAELYPTPNQPEQEYLAKIYNCKKHTTKNNLLDNALSNFFS